MAKKDFHNTVRNRVSFLIFIVWATSFSSTVYAQLADTTLTFNIPLTHFENAVSLSIDTQGKLYVIDAANATLSRINQEGIIEATFGGLGEGVYAFNDPRAVAPTNGLEIYVADAGKHQIIKYSKAFRHLATYPLTIPDDQAESILRAAYHEADITFDATGTPIALTTDVLQNLYVIDESQGIALVWNPIENKQHIFGRFDEQAGGLLNPVSIATDSDGRIFIADKGHEAVMVYDEFGSYSTAHARGLLKELQSISVYKNRLLITLSNRLLVYETTGMMLFAYDLVAPSPVLASVYSNGFLFFLTSEGLYKMLP